MEKKFIELAEKLRELQGKVKFLKGQASKYAAVLKEMCDGETTSFKGYTYMKIERKGSIKYALIPELKDLDLEPYRGDTIESWKLNYDEQFEEIM